MNKSLFVMLFLLMLVADSSGAIRPFLFDRGPTIQLEHHLELLPDQSGMQLRVRQVIRNDQLQFVRIDSGRYRARYQITLEVFQDRISILHDYASRELDVTSYAETRSRDTRYDYEQVFQLSPGEYDLWIELHDQESDQVSRQSWPLEVPDLTKHPVWIGGLELLHLKQDSTGTDVQGVPIIGTDVDENLRPLGFSFLTITGNRKSESYAGEFSIRLVRNRRTIYQLDSTRYIPPAGGHRSTFSFPESILSAGHYTLHLTGKLNGRKFSEKRDFNLRWQSLPRSMSDMDLAIRQLQYIAPSRIWREMQHEEMQVRRDRFLAFWEARDPNPATEVNELQVEYYNRCNRADIMFSAGHLEGWRTDRGRIYILYGQPDTVESHPMNPDGYPYEVWVYTDKDLRFVFVDEYGFGDYRLITPSY